MKESKGIEFIGEVPLNFERILHYDTNLQGERE